jgi:hypothetical protein
MKSILGVSIVLVYPWSIVDDRLSIHVSQADWHIYICNKLIVSKQIKVSED